MDRDTDQLRGSPSPAGSGIPMARVAPATYRIELLSIGGLPMVQAGDDLAALLIAGMAAAGLEPRDGDVVVVAQKIVSQAEGRLVALRDVTPSAEAMRIAGEIGKDARLVELILSESVRIVRQRRELLITEHRLGWVMANAGVDQSNIGGDADQRALLLPIDPDRSADALLQRLSDHFGVGLATVINDSFGRPWRIGTTGVALGAAGLPAVVDRRGDPDLFGRPLRLTQIAFADEIAAAASLLMGPADEARPAVLVRGLTWSHPPSPAAALVRPAAEDLFR